MAPIRVAIIGLSQSAKTSWASVAHLPYLLSDRGREQYQIKALLNSSVEAARRAIEYYQLPSDTKAYGSPSDLAADGDIDLVVCTTRVDVHHDTIKPSVAAGKAVFVEWPLAENATRANELASLAKESKSQTIIGLQARVSPAICTLKAILEDGGVGKVLSSSVKAFTPLSDRESISEGLGYFFNKQIGGNLITIAFGHMIDFVHSVLGEYEYSSSHVQIQRPNQMIVNRDSGESKSCISDVPDLVSVHGVLQSSSFVTAGASLLMSFRTGPPFPGTAPFIWTINCEKGEIRMTSERGPFIQSESSAHPILIEVLNFSTGIVSTIDWQWEDWQESLIPRGRNIAKLYDLYANGALTRDGCATFESAVVRHKQLDKMLYS